MEKETLNKKEYFDEIAGSLRNRMRYKSYYWHEITSYCKYFSHDNTSVLQIGCGNGDLLNEIKGSRKVGIDFSERMISIARDKYSHLDFRLMEAENITFDEKFDLIIISQVIGFLDDIQKVLMQLHKVCHENTKVIIVYYNYLWEPILKLSEIIGIKTKAPTQNWLTLKDIKNILYISGFDVYRNTKRMLIPVYIPLISTIFNRYLAKLPIFKTFCINFYTFAKFNPLLNEESVNDKYSVSIVIPARNEEDNIEEAIKRMPKFGKELEIIFIEGHSTDNTWNKIQEIKEKYSKSHNIKIAQQTGKGKADAVRLGYSIATKDIYMILDADLTVPPEDLPKFYNVIATGKADFVNGSRLVYPMEKEAMRFLNLLGNNFFGWAFSWLLGQQFKDTLCGTKVLFKKDYERLVLNRKYFGDFDPFGDFDLLFGAYKLNLKIVDVPIRYRERTYGSTNISRFSHGLLLLKMCWVALKKIKFHD
ncbi:MAG: glycosyltransferase [Bacteroidota bacterium]|nr:glycosyltransferase [Bacteroidota bacterium]